MRGTRVCVIICCEHDIMDSGGEMWDGDGRCFELNGCVRCC